MHLRGTGESFAANIGGRMIGTSAALAHDLAGHVMPGATPGQAGLRGGRGGLLSYAVGLAPSFPLPKPKGEELPE